MKKNLLTISDGNGVDVDFKKWPTLLQLMTLDSLKICNKSVIGASNELILMQLAEAINSHKIDCAIIQWTIPQRFDVIVDSFWLEQAAIDPTYYFNLIENSQRRWWVSSASKNLVVQEYHKKYISKTQAELRSQANILAAAELLKSKDIPFVFCLAYELKFSAPFESAITTLPWAWHQPNLGLHEFRETISKHQLIDQGFGQPHSAIQLEWLHNVVVPLCQFVDYPAERYYNIEKHLIR
jgi:hypothetical protein